MYKVKTEKFEGAFDVLLDLIEENKLSINEISLSKVCEGYLEHMKTLKDVPRSEAAVFLSVGATLLLIKSRTLISRIRELGRKRAFIFSREAFAGYEFGFLPPTKMDAGLLYKLARHIIESLPKPDILPEKTLAKIITIEQKSRDLINRIQDRLSGPLEKVISAKDKVELIVGFLAILELIKQGFFDFKQEGVFGEVELKRVVG